jgi:hypothetical protein
LGLLEFKLLLALQLPLLHWRERREGQATSSPIGAA